MDCTIDMGMKDPVPTFSYIIQKLAEKHSSLGYIHVIEPRLDAAALTDRVPQAHEVSFPIASLLLVMMSISLVSVSVERFHPQDMAASSFNQCGRIQPRASPRGCGDKGRSHRFGAVLYL